MQVHRGLGRQRIEGAVVFALWLSANLSNCAEGSDMKIITRLEFDSTSGQVLLCESFDYYGPLTLCTGAEVGAAAAGGAKAAADTAAIAGTAAGVGATGAGAGALASAGLVEAGFGLGGAGFGAMSAAELSAGLGAAAAGAGAGAGVLSTLKDVATVASPVFSAASTLQGMSAAKRMGSMTGVPQVSPLVPMPSLGDLGTMNAMRANLQQQLQRRGRAATILTAPSGDRLGS